MIWKFTYQIGKWLRYCCWSYSVGLPDIKKLQSRWRGRWKSCLRSPASLTFDSWSIWTNRGALFNIRHPLYTPDKLLSAHHFFYFRMSQFIKIGLNVWFFSFETNWTETKTKGVKKVHFGKRSRGLAVVTYLKLTALFIRFLKPFDSFTRKGECVGIFYYWKIWQSFWHRWKFPY